MFGEITIREFELLVAINTLNQTGQRDLEEYLRFLLSKQYKKEMMATIFNNQLLHSLLHSLLHLIERDDYEAEQVEKRMKQVNEVYYGLFEQVHQKYSEVITDLDSHEIVKEFGKNSFENIERAYRSQDRKLIRMEIIEFYEGFNKLAKKKDARKIAAV